MTRFRGVQLMDRRVFVATMGASVLVAPRIGVGQPASKAARLGVLLFSTPEGDPSLSAFRQGLTELGYVEGRSLTTVYRYAEGKPERRAAKIRMTVSNRDRFMG